MTWRAPQLEPTKTLIGAAGCDAAVADLPLTHAFHKPWRPDGYTLRWVYLHMIEEYARHNGHADLLRERIDGVTGSF